MSSSSLATVERQIVDAMAHSMRKPPRRFAASAEPISQAGVKQMLLAYRAAAKRGKLAAVLPGFKMQPGMVYTKVRAISARINQNYDAWPSAELKKSYKTFLGKPIFVNHNNFDPDRARGVVVASRYIEKGADKYIEVIQEADGQRFPKLGSEIKSGGLDSVSMGVEAGFTVCSYCNNKATDVFDMCDHVKFHKGSYLPDPRTGESKLVYENCYKLGFFELSYVFDPADETAVVSQVVTAARDTAYLDRTRYPRARRSLNETRAPEDIDTLSEDDQGDSDDDYEFVSPYHPSDEQEDIPFHGGQVPPDELLEPDMDKAHRLDRQQEDQGLDGDRAVEDVEEVGAPQDEGAPAARAATRRRSAMARTRTGRRRYAEDAPPWADEEASQDGPPPEDDGGDDGSQDDGSGGQSDGDLIDEAEADLEQARQADDSGDDQGGDDEGSDEDEGGSDSDDGEGDDNVPPQFRDSRRQRPRQARRRYAEDDKDDDDSDDDSDDDDDDSDKPPWLKEKESQRRAPVRNGSPRKKGRKKGATVGAPALSSRGRVASQGRRQHFADDNGYTDGGPYGTYDQPQPEEQINTVFGEGDGVPPEEPLAAPTGDGSKAPNSEAQLVARIERQTQALKGDIATWQRLQGRKQKRSRRRTAEDLVDPTVVNPELSATDDQSLKGDDFQDPGLEDTTIHPTDGDSNNKIGRDQSRQWFAAFDNWLRQTTQRSWNQHSSAHLTRLAARWSKSSGVPLDNLFPTLQTALREARKGEARRANVRRHAEDEALEVAAPDERVETDAPTSGDTDERAQASQPDLGDFGHNAFDDLAKPVNTSDSQIWAPDKGGTTAARVKMAEGMAATRCAEAYIKCGLAQPADKWKLASWLTTKRADIVDDRTKLLETVYATNRRAFSAARMPQQRRAQTVPPGFSRGRVAATQRIAENDPINDAALWL